MDFFHISCFSPEGVNILDMMISQWGWMAGRKKGNPTIKNPNFDYILAPEKSFFVWKVFYRSIVTFKAYIPILGWTNSVSTQCGFEAFDLRGRVGHRPSYGFHSFSRKGNKIKERNLSKLTRWSWWCYNVRHVIFTNIHAIYTPGKC